MTMIGLRSHSRGAMLKTVVCCGLVVAAAASPTAAHAENGDSSSYGSSGTGPTIPTQSLTPFDRAWNENNEARDEAIYDSEWLRDHPGGTDTFLGPTHPGRR
jgi:hypothetical protein